MPDLPFAHLVSLSLVEDCLAMHSGDGWHRDASKGLVELTGADVREWLQGQITNDIRQLSPQSPLQACICSPTGQLLADLTLYDQNARILIETDARCIPALMHRIEMMVVMEDVEGRDLSAAHTLIVSAKPLAAPDASIVFHSAGETKVWLPSESAWTPEGREVGKEAWEILRVEKGVPAWGKDMGEKTLPPEMGPAFERSRISYTKGCYTGQEVLMRIHSRGHTNKTWVRLAADAPLAEGAELTDSEGTKVGTVTSSVVSPRFCYLGAGIVRNLQAQPGTVLFAGDVAVRVENLGLSEA